MRFLAIFQFAQILAYSRAAHFLERTRYRQNTESPHPRLAHLTSHFGYLKHKTFQLQQTDDHAYTPAPINYMTLPSYMTMGEVADGSDGHDLTIITQISINRLNLLYDIAASWPGSLSVSLYVESYADLENLDSHLTTLSRKMSVEPMNQCRITLSLLFGLAFVSGSVSGTGSQHHPYDFLYPINALRNLALRNARTELVLSLDADFMPSSNAFGYLTSTRVYNALMRGVDRVFVVAAFEFLTTEYNVPVDRSQLDDLCVQALVVPFHSKIVLDVRRLDGRRMAEWCAGTILNYHTKITEIQFLTNFTRWFKASEIYAVDMEKNKLERHFEPYYVAHKSHLPAFDERFRGYSFNKRQHNIELQYLKFEFMVLPEVFVVHRWHPVSESKKKLSGMVKKSVGQVYERFLAEMAKKYREKKGAFHDTLNEALYAKNSVNSAMEAGQARRDTPKMPLASIINPMKISIFNKDYQLVGSIDASTYVESFTLEPLLELLSPLVAVGKCLILARVEKDYYYYAPLLNKLAFRIMTVGDGWHMFRIKCSNPLTNKLVSGLIEYYLVEPVYNDIPASYGETTLQREAMLEQTPQLSPIPKRRPVSLANSHHSQSSYQSPPLIPISSPSEPVPPIPEKYAGSKTSSPRDMRKSTAAPSHHVVQIQSTAVAVDNDWTSNTVHDTKTAPDMKILKVSRRFNIKNPSHNPQHDPDLDRKRRAIDYLVKAGLERRESSPEYKQSGRQTIVRMLQRGNSNAISSEELELEESLGAVAAASVPVTPVSVLARRSDPRLGTPAETASTPHLQPRTPSRYNATYIGNEDDFLASRAIRQLILKFSLESLNKPIPNLACGMLFDDAIPGWREDREAAEAAADAADEEANGERGFQESLIPPKFLYGLIGGLVVMVVVVLVILIPKYG